MSEDEISKRYWEPEYEDYREPEDDDGNDYEIPSVDEVWTVSLDINYNLNICVEVDKSTLKEIVNVDEMSDEYRLNEALNQLKDALQYLIKKIKKMRNE